MCNNEEEQYYGEYYVTGSKIRGVEQNHEAKFEILPPKVKLNFLRYTLVDKNQNSFWYPEKDAPKEHYPVDAPQIDGHKYITTLLRPGYLYLTFENKPNLFKEFKVLIGGNLTNIISDLKKDIREPKGMATTSYYMIDKEDTVWVCYSEFQWSADFIRKIRSDSKLKEKRMQKFVAADWICNKNIKAFNFYKEDEMKEVDIIIDSPVKYPDARRDCVQIRIGGLTIPVISIKKLIKMKKDTGRPMDKLDIDTLKTIERLKRKAI